MQNSPSYTGSVNNCSLCVLLYVLLHIYIYSYISSNSEYYYLIFLLFCACSNYNQFATNGFGTFIVIQACSVSCRKGSLRVFLPLWFSPPSWLLLVCNAFTSKYIAKQKVADWFAVFYFTLKAIVIQINHVIVCTVKTYFSGRTFKLGPLLASKTAPRPKIK